MEMKKKTVTTSDGIELDWAELSALGRIMATKFSTYKKDRRLQELQWMKNLRQFMGKYDPDIEAQMDPKRSRAYPKITRTKLMTIVARLMNLLFPQGDKSWAIESSRVPNLKQDELDYAFSLWVQENPDKEISEDELDAVVREFARKAASQLEMHIEDQLNDSMGGDTESDSNDFVALCRRVIISAAIFNVGVLKGPMTIAYDYSRPVVVPGAKPTVETRAGYRPYFEFVDVWDYYPDMQAKSFPQMDGQFEDHIYAKHQLQALAKRDDFLGQQIKEYLKDHPEGNYVAENYEQDLDVLNERREMVQRSNKYRVTEWWGSVSTHTLKKVGVSFSEPGEVADPEVEADEAEEGRDAFYSKKEEPEEDDGDVTRSVVWFIGDTPIKVEVDPLPATAAIYHQFVFDDSVPALCGGSMTEVVRDSQMSIAAAARMMIDNASVTCGPNLEIDMSLLVDGQDNKGVGPFQNWYKDGSRSSSGHKAVQSISFDNHLPELIQVMNTFMNFADIETFVSTQGDAANTPGEALRTTGGASMVLGNAALPFRDIVRSFDQFTTSVINSMVAWNRLFNGEIDMMGDMRPVAKGATSLIAKEVRAFQLDNLKATLDEDDMLYIDREKLVKQRLSARDVPAMDVMASESEVKRRIEARDAAADVERRRADRLFELDIKERQAEILKDSAQAKKNLDTADATAVKTVAKLMETGADVDDRVQQREQGAAPSGGSGGSQ
jgi:hypothetical protein